MSDDNPNAGGGLKVLKVIGIIFAAFLGIVIVIGISSRESPSNQRSGPVGGSLAKKFRKKIGMCCLLVGLAVAVSFTGLVKNYIYDSNIIYIKSNKLY